MRFPSLRTLAPVLSLFLFLGAITVLYYQLENYDYADIAHAVSQLPLAPVALALLLTVLSYFVLTGYDALAFRYVGKPLSYPRLALASFVAYALSNNIGLAGFSGAPVRYRFYAGWGISAPDTARVVVFGLASFWVGVLAVAGVTFLVQPLPVPAMLHVPSGAMRPLGAILLGLLLVYVLWSLFVRRPLRVGSWELPAPKPSIVLAQIVVGVSDWVLASAVLYVLLPATPELSFLRFLSIFMLGQVAGLASQVPGGLGVFETVVLLLLPAQLPSATVLGVLMVYRVVYYLTPLTVAALLLGAGQALQSRRGFEGLAGFYTRWVAHLIIPVFSLTTFLAGVVLIFSGAVPRAVNRLHWLEEFLPLGVLEVSSFLSSLAGIGLIVLARGISRRLDVAYPLTVALLLAGIVLALLKGGDYDEALVLLVLLLALLPTRHLFYRKAALIEERLTPVWLMAIAVVVSGSIWLGLVSHRSVGYTHALWLNFSYAGDASRFLRSTGGVLAVVLYWVGRRLFSPARPSPSGPTPEDLERVKPVVERATDTKANLALLGDKTLLFNAQGTAFIMYGVEGRSWIAMGDPVGPMEEGRELVWEFRELCDRFDGWPVFYQVSPAYLHLYLDLGLDLLKLGEEARVPLAGFSMSGGAHKSLRAAVNRLEREGYRFEVRPADQLPEMLPALRTISDAWLSDKNTREKGFSLGYFDPAYLTRHPMAVVCREDRLVAFANLWLGAEKKELSIDLMRHLPEAPPGTMDYLFTHLMLWGHEQGYHWFNLGMAPLSGLDERILAPLWNRLGHAVYRHGQYFYNFQGLRRYKEKFHPQWEARYLAFPNSLALPQVLTNLASLIGGGLKGIISR